MSENPFAGTTDDPVGMQTQLIRMVAKVQSTLDVIQQDIVVMKQDIAAMKQDIAELRARMDWLEGRVESISTNLSELRREQAETRAEVRELRSELVRMHRAIDQAYGALKTQVSAEIEQKAWLESQRVLEQAETRWAAMERRVAELEAAERRRREGTGA